MNNSYNDEKAFIKRQSESIQTPKDFEHVKENCFTYCCKVYGSKLNVNGIMKEAMELYAKVVEHYNESYLNPITALFADWLKTQDLDNPNFETAHKVHDWRNYVSHNVQDNWGLLTSRERAIIAIIGQKQADNENWD